MSLENKRTIKCEKCSKEFDVTTYESINVDLNPELRELVLNNKIYEFECPNCHHIHHIPYPFIYHDMKHKFMIDSGNFGSLILSRKEFKEANNKINNDFGNITGDYTYCGVQSPFDLFQKILVLEKGYDHKVIEVAKLLVLYHYFDEKKDTPKDCDCYIDSDKNNNLIFVIDDRTSGDCNVFALSDEFYKAVKEQYYEDLSQVDGYIFDRKSAIKFLSLLDDKTDDTRKQKYNFAIVKNQFEQIEVAYSLPICKGLNINDHIAIVKYDEKNKEHISYAGIILDFFEMTDFEFPYEINDLPITMYKIGNIDVITSDDSDAELNNELLSEKLLSFKKDFKYQNMPFDLVENSNAIIGMITIGDVNPDNLLNILKKDKVTAEELNMRTLIQTVKVNDEDYLLIYVNQKDVKDENVSKFVYKAKDIIRIFLNNPFKYKGISIRVNDESINLSYGAVIDLIFDNIMHNEEKMKNLLLTLDDKEINFMDKDNFEIVKDIYINNSYDKLKEKYTDDILSKKISSSYKYIKQIIYSRLSPLNKEK